MTSIKLDDILDKTHGLYQMANRMNWDYLVNELGAYYCEGPGRPKIPIRVIAGLHYLKYLENESDESVVEKFCMRIKLVVVAKKRGLLLRQTYVRIGKRASIQQARYAHAGQMKRARKAFKKVKSYLGRVTRDILRQVDLRQDSDLAFLIAQSQ